MSFIGKMIGNKCPLFDARLATSRKDTRFNYYDKKWLSAKHFGWENDIFCSSTNLAIIVPKPLVAYGSELFRGRFDRRLIQMTAAFILSMRLKQPSAQEAQTPKQGKKRKSSLAQSMAAKCSFEMKPPWHYQESWQFPPMSDQEKNFSLKY